MSPNWLICISGGTWVVAASCQSEILPEHKSKEWLRPLSKVSVIIPTYDRAAYLVEAIQSVLDQTFQDFELIAVDDGSTDNTREVVERFNDKRIRYLWQENHGVSAARNTGIKASSGEYIAFLDSDDIWLPENLELKVRLLDSRPDIGLVCSDAYLFHSNTGAILSKYWQAESSHHTFDPFKATREPIKQLFYRGCFIMPQASMIRRQVFDTVGYFDESLTTHEDWDFMVRIVQRYPIEIIDAPLLKLRRHDNNLSANQEKLYQGAMAAVDKVIRSGLFSKKQLSILKKRMFFHHISYGRVALLDGRQAVARKALIAGIKLYPWDFKSYAYLAFSFLGSRQLSAIISWKRKLQRHPLSCQPTNG